jgi:hypothetical protein
VGREFLTKTNLAETHLRSIQSILRVDDGYLV